MKGKPATMYTGTRSVYLLLTFSTSQINEKVDSTEFQSVMKVTKIWGEWEEGKDEGSLINWQ